MKVVIYAALSKKGDDADSLPSQVAKVRERLAQVYPDGYEIVGVFEDDGYSGSKRDRGPGLEAAIAAATTTAGERGHCEMWANTSARFARGEGGPKAARALGKLYYDLKAVGVALRTVVDDEYLSNEMLVGFASAQASKYSADLSESVTRAKRRQAQRGEHLGGPLPLGYQLGPGGGHFMSDAHLLRAADRPRPIIDPAHAPTIERIMELAEQGVPDSQVARTVNAEGFRTRKGRPFDRRAIQAIVCNPFYAARIVYDGETFEGQHPPLVAPEVFDRIQAARPKRDLGKGHHQAGAPARRHLLARLAVCGQCGERMYAVTAPYRRKDGTKARQYVCHAYKFATGLCDAKPVNAEVVDTAIMERLHNLLPDFEQWIEHIEDRHADERARLAQLVDKAEADHDRQAATVAKHERRYRDAVAADDDTKADLALEFVAGARRDLADAETRLKATRDALDSIPAEAPSDRLLDFAIALRDAIRGKTEGRTVEQVNRALHEAFESFVIWRINPLAPACVQPSHAVGGIAVEPILRPEVAAALFDWPAVLDKPEPAPPMEWLEAIHKSDHSQEPYPVSLRVGLVPLRS